MRSKSKISMYRMVLASVILIIVLLSLGCVQKEPGEIEPPTPTVDKDELLIMPGEFVIYQDYLETIGGKPGIHDSGTIEATVISITKTEVCPDKIDPSAPEPTGCSIEPYPKDHGIVRIDKISYYTRTTEQPIEQPAEPTIEQPSSPESTTNSAYVGSDSLAEKPAEEKEYAQLQEGQEVSTLFLVTVRPAKIRYVPINESQDGLESTQIPENGAHQTVSKEVEPEKKVFKPIPKDKDDYVFTTRIGDFSGIIEKRLPGLEVGSQFRAEIRYDGTLYVEEYELLT
jgi:hypothetical protein